MIDDRNDQQRPKSDVYDQGFDVASVRVSRAESLCSIERLAAFMPGYIALHNRMIVNIQPQHPRQIDL